MDKTENSFVIYPIHIDSSVSLGKGRKYSLNKSIENPTFREIKSALTSLNIEFKEEDDKIHPKEIKEKGRFVVNKQSERNTIIESLVSVIKESRNKKSQETDKSKATNNILNLKPKSKKKGGKASK